MIHDPLPEGRRTTSQPLRTGQKQDPETSKQCRAFDCHTNFPPPPDLTRYIDKGNDQYCAAGGFGDVYRCWYRDGSPKEVAVKSFRFRFTVDGGSSDTSIKMLRRELGIWRRLEHANIVPFLGITYGFGMRDSMALVSLWMHNESLHNFLSKHDDELAVMHRLQLLLDIVNGLDYLHSIPIIHGDLNSNNVLLDADYNARLADFGYASMVGEIPEALGYLQRSTVRPGALRWSPPEQIDLEGEYLRTSKSDIYSFGCIGLQVLSGKQPWSEVREDVAVILRLSKGGRPGRPASREMDDPHWNLIQRCLSSVEERPNTKEIIHIVEEFHHSCQQSPSLRDLLTTEANPATQSRLQQTPEHAGMLEKDKLASRATPPQPFANNQQELSLASPNTDQHFRTKGSVRRRAAPKPELPIVDVLFVSQTGTGRSTLINMIRDASDKAKGPSAKVSNEYFPCTTETTCYPVTLGDLECRLWDMRGLDEAAVPVGGGDEAVPRRTGDRWLKNVAEKIRQRKIQQHNQLEKELRDRTKLETSPGIPILLWCIDAAKVDVVVQYELFQKVYVDYCGKNVKPVVVINRVQRGQEAGWEEKCSRQLEELLLGNVPKIRVRWHGSASSTEYEEDAQDLGKLIYGLTKR